MRIRKITQNTRDFKVTDPVVEGGTDLNKETFNGMQNNIEDGINEISMKALSNGYDIDTIKQNGKFVIFNAKGTLPNGYSTNDNNIFIDSYLFGTDYGRQILHDVRTNKSFSRNLSNGVWQEWSSNNYSTEETFTGKYWINGKKVYRKVVDFGGLPSSGVKTVAHNIQNLDLIINYDVLATNGNVSWKMPLLNISALARGAAYNINKTIITIDCGSEANRSDLTTCYAIIEYTKTTD